MKIKKILRYEWKNFRVFLPDGKYQDYQTEAVYQINIFGKKTLCRAVGKRIVYEMEGRQKVS